MFGQHNVPLQIEQEQISLSIEKEGDILLYKREYIDELVEKRILAKNADIIINPIKPINKPKKLTPYIIIEFENKLVIEPRAARKVYLKFPVEIGIFISQKKEFEILDIFSLTKNKFTLYGEPTGGAICKYWKSDVYSSIPSANPIYEGVLELNIKNKASKWEEIRKAVFNSYGMKIYYNENMISLKASMTIMNDVTAETDFIDSPLEKSMTGSIELYNAKKLQLITTKFVMRDGI